MRQQRWFPIAVLAVGLFALNAAARLTIRLTSSGSSSADDGVLQNRASIVMFALLGVVLAVWTFRRARRQLPMGWLIPDWTLGVGGGMLLTVLVGPFISGGTPFGSAEGFAAQVALYAVFAGVGTLLGYWVAVVMGVDVRSRTVRAAGAARRSKPHKVVRR